MPQRKNKTEREIEREILLKIFRRKRKALMGREKSKDEIAEIREIIRRLRKLRGF